MKSISNNYYIIGKVMGGNRTENLIKFLVDNNKSVYYNSFGNSRGLFSLFFNLYKKLTILLNLMMADIVIMPAMCNSFQFEFTWAKRMKKIIITDFYVSLYDTHVLDKKPTSKGKIVDENSSKANRLKAIDRTIIENADLAIFLNKAEAKYYLEILKIDYSPTKHIIIPICTTAKSPAKLNFYFNPKSNVFNVCWWGTYIPLHGLEKIINAAAVLRKNYKIEFHFHLFGNNEKKSKPYRSLIKELNLNDIVSIYNDKTFSNGKLNSFLEEKCDLALGNFGNSGKSKHILANKIIDGVSMRVPILTGESIGPREYFSHNELFYTSNSADSIAQSIFDISQVEPESIKVRINKSYEIFQQHFSIGAYNRELEDIFHKL